jgi:hypothetical protein
MLAAVGTIPTDGQRPRYEVCAVEGGREGNCGAAREQEETAAVP